MLDSFYHMTLKLLKNRIFGVKTSRFCRILRNVIKDFITLRHYIVNRRMAENGFAPPPREFCRHILSCRELNAESFKRCLHSVLRGVSL